MRRLFAIGVATLVPLFVASSASGAVDQFHDSVHHEVSVVHDTNICGNPGTFTFDTTSHTHAFDNGTTVLFNFTETVKYTLVFDDPALGTWSAHGTETIKDVANRGGEVFHDIFNSKEGPVQIIEHLQLHVDAEGNIRVDHTFERHVGC